MPLPPHQTSSPTLIGGYVARGGKTFVLGDGALNCRPVRVLEVYCSFAVAKGTCATVDVQHLANPGYNADRGPVAVYNVRLHWENN